MGSITANVRLFRSDVFELLNAGTYIDGDGKESKYSYDQNPKSRHQFWVDVHLVLPFDRSNTNPCNPKTGKKERQVTFHRGPA